MVGVVIDILFVSYNRLAFTAESFQRLLENTDWDLVRAVYLHDDGSTDGTWEYLNELASDLPDGVEVVRRYGAHAGPVGATNWYLDASLERGSPPEAFAKIDNDFVVCPGWLEEMLAVLEDEQLDILGMEPMVGDPTPPPLPGRSFRSAEFIGGKGILRRSTVYADERRMPSTRFPDYSFSHFQRLQCADLRVGWIAPDLPVFGLDQLPPGVVARGEDWHARALEYADKGWQRLDEHGELLWGTYHPEATAYWEWWIR